MQRLLVETSKVGFVAVSEEVEELLEANEINSAIEHLRMGGENCWVCPGSIRPSDDVSLIVQLAPTGCRLSFTHFKCAPPQIVDDRRNRRVALAFDRYLGERSADAQAFALWRNFPSPHAVLVVSQETPMRTRADNGDSVQPWLNRTLEEGFSLIPPDVLDADPEELPGWSLRVEGRNVICGSIDGALYEGRLDMPSAWLEALAYDRRCLVLASAIGISSDELGDNRRVLLKQVHSKRWASRFGRHKAIFEPAWPSSLCRVNHVLEAIQGITIPSAQTTGNSRQLGSR